MAKDLQPHALSPSPSQFSFTLTKIATVQILKSNGYKSAQSSALDALTRIATLYLHSLSSLSASRANSRGHTHCSLHDVVFSLLDLHSLSSSLPNALSQLRNYLSAPPHLPFPRKIPSPRFETLPSTENVSKRHSTLETKDDAESRQRRFETFLDEPPRQVINVSKQHSTLETKDVAESRHPRFETFLDEPPRQAIDVSKRRPDVPAWLPAFPRFETVAEIEDVSKRGEGGGGVTVTVRVSKGEKRKKEKKGWKGEGCLLMGKRERVRFMLGKRRERGVEEVRNGVCRGGKRVCLVGKKLGGNYFCDDDYDDDGENCSV